MSKKCKTSNAEKLDNSKCEIVTYIPSPLYLLFVPIHKTGSDYQLVSNNNLLLGHEKPIAVIETFV